MILIVNMFTNNVKRARGRPAGPTAQAAETRQHLYAVALELMGTRGFAATTLRDIAATAGVSVGLLYRYFPTKHAVLLALYDDLSSRFAAAAVLPDGRWRDRFVAALRTSLGTLAPHRVALAGLTPVLLGDATDGVFAAATAFSRRRVTEVFERAVVDATDAPPRAVAHALGRVLYLVHLAVLLWWLLDRTPRQRATTALVDLAAGLLPSAALALRLPSVRTFVVRLDALAQDALVGETA